MLKPDRTQSTTCPYCGVGCNLILHIKDNFIYRVTSPFDAVVNQGNLCVKGRFGYDFIYHPDRVTTPLVRKVPQQAGARTQAFDRSEWRQASWDEALDLVADRLVEIYRQDGAGALAAYLCAKATNEDNYLLQKMFRALFRTNHIDHCTRLCHAGSVVALQQAIGSSAMSNTAAEVIKSDCFIVTGSNTTENHPIIALQMKAAVRKHGARLIVVDPRRMELCDYATLWLPLRPGTNVPVFSAMAHVILKENLVNWEFVNARTEGLEDFARSVEKFTPEYAEAISWVDRGLIAAAARMYATAERGAIYWGMGISQLSHGTASALSLIHLAFLTGHIGREGTGLNPLRGQNNVQGASDMGAMPFHFPGYMAVDDPANAPRWEAAWNIEPGGLNRKRGLTTTEILANAHPGGVRALYIMGENPMMSEPNLNQTRQHMQQLEFLVAQDLFINESGAFADVFLPSTSWAEKDGTFTNTDRRVQRVHSAILPRGASRPDWQIICNLAGRIESRLGVTRSAGWQYTHPAEIMAEIGAVVPEYAGVTYARLEKNGLQTPVWDSGHPGTPFLFAKSFPRGRGKFHPLEYVPTAEPPDDEFPFILTTGRVLEHWHGGTMTRHSKLDELYPQATVEINPADAALMGVSDGQVVRVASRRGAITLRAQVTPKTTAGVVFIPFHFAEAAANLLTIDALDPQAKIPEFKACAVQISPAQAEEARLVAAWEPRGRY
ncbi:MAG: formate dehydrogenase subunit alpha [Anaerolineales bacterium]|nr:formate dehydrogenase subunit alpha [Anaerolineales bacterium]